MKKKKKNQTNKMLARLRKLPKLRTGGHSRRLEKARKRLVSAVTDKTQTEVRDNFHLSSVLSLSR